MDGWVGVKAVLRIAYSNQQRTQNNSENIIFFIHSLFPITAFCVSLAGDNPIKLQLKIA
jgi:hypothetical protein